MQISNHPDYPDFPVFSAPISAPKPTFRTGRGIRAYAETRFALKIQGISGFRAFGDLHQSSSARLMQI